MNTARRPGIVTGVGVVVLYFLLQMGFGALFGALVAFTLALRAQLAGGSAALRAAAEASARALQSNPDFRVVLTAATITAAAATTALLVHRFWPVLWSRPDLPGLGFARAPGRGAYLGAIALGLAALVVGGALTSLLAHGQPVQQDISVLAHSVSPGLRILLVVLAVAVAPVAEELIFRGVLLSGLARRMPVGWAMALSAAAFGAAHLPDFGYAWFPIPELVLLGVVLAWIRVRTRSLWPAIATHATFNLVATLGGFFLSHPPH